MSTILPLDDEVLRGGAGRMLHVIDTLPPELQLCENTDWAEIKWLQETGIKHQLRRGPEVEVRRPRFSNL